MKKIFVLLLSIMIGNMLLPVSAKADVAKAELDSAWVVIGMPCNVHLEVTVPDGAVVQWPDLGRDGIVAADFENVEKKYTLEYGPDLDLKIDTIRLDGGMITLRQTVQVFALDSAAMVIAPFRFVVNDKDTLSTQMLALKCEQPFEIQDPQALADLKDIISPEFVLWDYIWWMGWVLLAVAVAFAAWYGYQFYLKHRSEAPVVEVPQVKLPAHITALQALEALGEKKLWQEGKFKQFHTELTDILRQYIEERYHVLAMESTTDEILEELLELTMTQRSSYNNLKEVLQMADLVKFAKYEPLPDENQMVYMNSRLFIEQTKESVVEESKKTEEEQ